MRSSVEALVETQQVAVGIAQERRTQPPLRVIGLRAGKFQALAPQAGAERIERVHREDKRRMLSSHRAERDRWLALLHRSTLEEREQEVFVGVEFDERAEIARHLQPKRVAIESQRAWHVLDE